MKTPLAYFMDGFNAAENGLPEDDCPLVYKAWPRDAWLEGHRFAETYSGPWLNMAPKLPLERVEKPPEVQGALAFAKGIAIDGCPYEPDSQDYRRWRLGWIEAFNEREQEDADRKVDFKARRAAVIAYILCALAVIAALVWAKFA